MGKGQEGQGKGRKGKGRKGRERAGEGRNGRERAGEGRKGRGKAGKETAVRVLKRKESSSLLAIMTAAAADQSAIQCFPCSLSYFDQYFTIDIVEPVVTHQTTWFENKGGCDVHCVEAGVTATAWLL